MIYIYIYAIYVRCDYLVHNGAWHGLLDALALLQCVSTTWWYPECFRQCVSRCGDLCFAMCSASKCKMLLSFFRPALSNKNWAQQESNTQQHMSKMAKPPLGLSPGQWPETYSHDLQDFWTFWFLDSVSPHTGGRTCPFRHGRAW